MKRMIVAILLLFSIAQGSAYATNDSNEYLISFYNDIDYLLLNDFDVQVVKEYKKINMVKAVLPNSVVNELKNENSIEFIEEDGVVVASLESTDTNNSQTIPWGFKAINAGISHEEYKGRGVSVAVFDSGIDVDHPDLTFVEGISFVEGTSFDDDFGHGTHVAGTIAAKENDIGIIGIAPLVDLYVVKVLDRNGNGQFSNIIEALSWSIENDIQIVSASIGTRENSKSLEKSFKHAEKEGLIIVSAAGNYGSYDMESSNIAYPAAYSSVISVGAIDNDNKVATFSSVGKELDFVAPGVSILSTFNDGGYAFQSGTSMAAPHLTGIIALLLEKNPTLEKKEIMKILKDSSTPLGDSFSYGYGLIDAYKAINY